MDWYDQQPYFKKGSKKNTQFSGGNRNNPFGSNYLNDLSYEEDQEINKKPKYKKKPHYNQFRKYQQKTQYSFNQISLKNTTSKLSVPLSFQTAFPTFEQVYGKDQICDKYLGEKQQIDQNSYGFGNQIKKLKKTFIQVQKVQKLQICASKKFPMIYFQYLDKNKTRKYKIFTEILQKIKRLTTKTEIVEQIFSRLYLRVDLQYNKLIAFGRQKEKLLQLGDSSENMLYFTKGQKGDFNFILFDKFFQTVEFDSNFIIKNQGKYSSQYNLFLKFSKSILRQSKQQLGQLIDLMDNEQMQSDEDIFNFKSFPISQLKIRLQKLLDKDLSQLTKKIDSKLNQIDLLSQSDQDNDKILELRNQIQNLQENKENYESVRLKVKEQLRSNKISSKQTDYLIKNSLKKMILVEKQMQSNLPIIGKKRQIVQLLKNQNLLIIEGQTGSGKSTQLPQILCEFYELFDNPKALPVLVTQPRRLATRSLAERVAKQMGQQVGGFVDYMASSGKKINPDAKIIFKLDRLVLDQLTKDRILSHYSCLVIDQAHERTLSIDVILGLVKQLLKKRKDFKVIVTSASMDIGLFQKYFSTKTLKVSGRMYPVSVEYKDYSKYNEGDQNQVVKKIQRVINEEILYDNNSMKKQFKGHLLCFCSNLQEISQLVNIYKAKLNNNNFMVFALHGKLTPQEQKQVFEETCKHKFIFASRIAETAITIDGVRVVIDPGKDFQLVFDQKYKVSSMKLQQITQSSAKQRAGRSGRTGPGYCFRLYSEQNFKQRKVNKTPEIQNSSLQTVVLRLKTLKIQDVINFPYISKPSLDGLKKSLELLKLIGALYDKDQSVTRIGQLLVRIPIEPFLSRAIIEAIIFEKVLKNQVFKSKLKLPKQELAQIQDSSIKKIVIQILSLIVNFSSLFVIKKQDRQKGEFNKFKQFSDEEGDFFFLDNVYKKYKNLKSLASCDDNQKKGHNKDLRNWLQTNFLSSKALHQADELIRQIGYIVGQFSLSDSVYQDELDNVKSKLLQCKTYRQVILSCMITSFSANLCKFSGNQFIGYTMVSQRKPIQVYGTSNLSLLGIQSDWIICYDLYTNQLGRLYCKVAHQVSYEFMKKHIDKYLWKAFNISAIQQKNPFYKELSYDLPTKILQQIRFDYNKSQSDAKFEFLKDTFPIISQQQNKISFYLLVPQKDITYGSLTQQHKKKIDPFQREICQYIKNINKQLKLKYSHNYIGNIFVNMQSGFKIEDIEFNDIEFCVQIISKSKIIEWIAEECENYDHFGKYFIEAIVKKQNNPICQILDEDVKKIKVYIKSKGNKKQFYDYLNELKKISPNIEIQIRQFLQDKRKKIPHSKIILHFFAGQSQKQNLFMFYGYPLQKGNLSENMCKAIQKGIAQMRNHRFKGGKLGLSTLKVAQKGQGINIFNIQYDEYQTRQQLYFMKKEGFLSSTFQFPKYIKRFRQPVISEARKSDDQWKRQIYKLLQKIGVDKQSVTINIRGFYKTDYFTRLKFNAFQKKLRVDMTAQISTFDHKIFPKFKNSYDGQKKVIGCEKVHARVSYEQVLAVPALQPFQSLQEQFEQQTNKLKIEYPLLTFKLVRKKLRNIQKMFIIANSPNRKDFIKTQRIIKKLFTFKIIHLQSFEYHFLSKMEEGQIILDELQEQYSYKIYFGFERFTKSLKLYSGNQDIKVIQNTIKTRLKQFNYLSEKISYRGKNLHKVKQILEQNMKKLAQREILYYEVIFQTRDIIITADHNTFSKVKSSLMKLANVTKVQCGICTDITVNPYRLLNCSCSFCWLCLSDHIKQFRNSPFTQLLSCPNEKCGALINIFDVKTILSQEQFQKICDIKINNYVQKTHDKYLACKFCENIFIKEEIQKTGQLNCQICGRIQCLNCGESHPDYLCQQWSNKGILNQKQMDRLGIKQCPVCKIGIQKTSGCDHMTCTNCSAHICWKCLKTFKTSQLCNIHMYNQCLTFFQRYLSDEDFDF